MTATVVFQLQLFVKETDAKHAFSVFLHGA